jgi:hypothetical protein
MKIIALIDSAEALAGSMKHAEARHISYVANTRAGCLACELGAVPYRRIDEYVSRKEIVDLGWRNFRALDAFSERADDLLLAASNRLRNTGIRPLRFSYYEVKIMMDSISTKLLMLDALVNHEKCDVLLYPARMFQHKLISVALLRHGSLYQHILESGLISDISTIQKADQYQTGSTKKELHILNRSRSIIANTLRKLYWRINRIGRHKVYALFNRGHDINYLIRPLKKAGYFPLDISNTISPITGDLEEGEHLKGVLYQHVQDLNELFSVKAKSYRSIIDPFLEDLFANQLPSALRAYDALKPIVQKRAPVFGLTGTVNLGLVERSRMEVIRNFGAPLITYQEGAGYGTFVTPIYDYTEMKSGDYFLAYGDGIPQYYREAGIKVKNILVTGSPHQDAVRRRLSKQERPRTIRRIMYVGTVVEDNILHCPNNGFLATAYFSTQLRLLRALCTLPSTVEVIAKPNPHDEMLVQAITHLPELCRVRLETRCFEDVLNDADLFILDFPSTVLLSCVSTRAYIFLLMEEGVASFTKSQENSLEKRAWIFHSFDALEEMIRSSVVCAPQPRLDNDYLLHYGILSEDGESTRRALDALLQISQERRYACGNSF